jgi:hypothetical protein
MLIARFLRLGPARQALVAEAAGCLYAVELGLVVLPFRFILRRLERTKSVSAHPDPDAAARVVWAVAAAGRHLPWVDGCLCQALAARAMLGRRGIPASFRIGVLKNTTGALQAHAWLEANGSVLIGGPEAALAGYTPLAGSGSAQP